MLGIEYTYKLLVQGEEIRGHSKFFVERDEENIEAQITAGIKKYWPEAEVLRIKIKSIPHRPSLNSIRA